MSTYVKADDQSALQNDGVELKAELARDRTHALVSLGTATECFVLELDRGEVVRLAQTLMAMAGVMVEG